MAPRRERYAASGLFLVNQFRIEHALADHLQLVVLKPTEEAALIALVARGVADLMDFEENRIVVAIEEDFLHFLHVARLFAFAPELVAAAAKVDGPFRTNGFLERFLVHVR